MKLTHYLGDRPFWKTLARLAFPIALQNLLSSSFSLVDTLMVGTLGDIPLSAIGMAGQYSWFLSIILFGLTSGLTLFAAQFWGVKDIPSIRRVYGIAFIIGCSVAGVFTFVGAAFPQGVMLIFNRKPEVVSVGVEYLSLAAYSYIAMALNYIFMGILRSTEQVRLPLFATLFSTVVNGGLNYIFIFGLAPLGILPMGARGAALATLISAWLSPAIIFVVSLVKRNILIAPVREMFGFSKAFLKEFLRRALPVITNETIWGLGSVIFNLAYSNLGHEIYAAVTILRTFESIAFVFFIGLGNASSVIIGKQVGAGKIDSAIRDSRRFIVLAPLISLFLCAVIVIFRTSIVGLFDLSGAISETTIGLATTILCIYACEMPIRNIPYILLCGIFRPGGETKKGMKYDLLFEWAVSLPITLAAAYLLKLPFPFVFAIMYISEDWLKSFFSLRYYFSKKWIKPVTPEGKEGLAKYNAEQNA